MGIRTSGGKLAKRYAAIRTLAAKRWGDNNLPQETSRKFMQLQKLWQNENRTRVLAISFAIIVLIAVIDWRTHAFLALGIFYLFPIMFAARFLPRWLTVLLAIACGTLAELFGNLDPSFARLALVCSTLAGGGLFAGELSPKLGLPASSHASPSKSTGKFPDRRSG